MTVTTTNPNGFSVTGISFSDTYPAGLVPDQVGVVTCNAGSAVFTGTGVPPGGPASATLNATIPNTPTLSEWMLVVLAMVIAAVAAIRLRPL